MQTITSMYLRYIDMTEENDNVNDLLPIQAMGLTTIKCKETDILVADGSRTIFSLSSPNVQDYTHKKSVIISFDPPLVINVNGQIVIDNPSSLNNIVIKNAIFIINSNTNLGSTNKLIKYTGSTTAPIVTFCNCIFLETSDVYKYIILDNSNLINCAFLTGIYGKKCLYEVDALTSSSGYALITGNVFLSNMYVKPYGYGIFISNNYFLYDNRTSQQNTAYIYQKDVSITYINNNIFVIADGQYVIRYEDFTTSSTHMYENKQFLFDNLFLYINGTSGFPIYYTTVTYNGIQHLRFGEDAVFADNNIINIDVIDTVLQLQHNFLFMPYDLSDGIPKFYPFVYRQYSNEEIQQIMNSYRSTASTPISSKHPDSKAVVNTKMDINTARYSSELAFGMPAGVPSRILLDAQGNPLNLNYPPEEVVRQGINYNFGLYTGRMIVPDENYVILGVPYDAQGTIYSKLGKFDISRYGTDIKVEGIKQ